MQSLLQHSPSAQPNLSHTSAAASAPADEDQDEFAEHFKRVRPPNVLITTSYKVGRRPAGRCSMRWACCMLPAAPSYLLLAACWVLVPRHWVMVVPRRSVPGLWITLEAVPLTLCRGTARPVPRRSRA